MQRTNNYQICQWNILDPTEIAALAAKNSAAAAISAPPASTQSNGVPVPRPRPPIDIETPDLTRQSVLQSSEERTMRPPHAPPRGASQRADCDGRAMDYQTSHKADDFDGCAMSRSAEGMDVTFLRTRDSLLLLSNHKNGI